MEWENKENKRKNSDIITDGPLGNDNDGGESVIRLYLLQNTHSQAKSCSVVHSECPGLLLLSFLLLFPRVLPGPSDQGCCVQ